MDVRSDSLTSWKPRLIKCHRHKTPVIQILSCAFQCQLTCLTMVTVVAHLAQLSELNLEIMKLVWCEWWNPSENTAADGGLTRDEIFERLKDKKRAVRRRPSKSAGDVSPRSLINQSKTLKSHLLELSSPPERLKVDGTADFPGAPLVYVMNDITTVTWPSTAFMLREVWRLKHVEQTHLVQMMTDQKDVFFSANKSATADETRLEINKQIEWSKSHDYLEHVEHHPNELHFTRRLRYEYRLLEYIARHANSDRNAKRTGGS